MIYIQLGAHQFCLHLGLQDTQSFKTFRDHLDVHRDMKQRFAVSVHIRGELRHVLKVALRGYCLLQVVGGVALHTILVRRVRDDTLVLYGSGRDFIDNFAAEVADYIDYDSYGEIRARQDGAVRTSQGYLIRRGDIQQRQDIDITM